MDLTNILQEVPVLFRLFLPGFFYMRAYRFTSWNDDNAHPEFFFYVWCIVISAVAEFVYSAIARTTNGLPTDLYCQTLIEIAVCIVIGLVFGIIFHHAKVNAVIGNITKRTFNNNMLRDVLTPLTLMTVYGKDGKEITCGFHALHGEILKKGYLGIIPYRDGVAENDLRVLVPFDDIREIELEYPKLPKDE